MVLAVNTVIQWDENSNRDEFERIVWLDAQNDIAFVFPLSADTNKSLFPYQCQMSEIENAINEKIAIQRAVDPFAKNFDADYFEKYQLKRDEAWNRIKEIALDEPNIYNPELRGKMVQMIAKKTNVTKRTIYKDLRKYWRYGKTINAMFPLYNHSGGMGKERQITQEMQNEYLESGETLPKRGRPRKGIKNQGKNLTVLDKANIMRIFENYYQKSDKPTLVEAHQKLLEKHYTIFDDHGEEIIDPMGNYPTLGQFKYYVYKNQDLRKSLIKREGLIAYKQRHRPVLGFQTQNEQIGPGSYYQLDATTLGVHIVNRLDRTRKISKPILYLVTDVMSRMIVGFHIGLGSSWEEARMALLDSFLNQGKFTSNVKDDLEKICYLPQVIVTDNGPEFKGMDSDSLADSLGIRVTNAPPYRPDLKPIVEQLFNKVRVKLRKLPGFVKEDILEKRINKNHRSESTLDIIEITEIVKEIFTFHNKHNLMTEYPQEEEMMKSDIVPYPTNIWEWGIENKIGAFKQISTDKAIISLLKKSEATITSQGIKFKKRYYNSGHALKEQWFLRGGTHENKRVNVAYDSRDIGVLYLVINGGQSIERCTLQSRSAQFDNYYFEEAKDWLDKKVEQKNDLQIDRHQAEFDVNKRIDKILEASKQKTLEAQQNNSKSMTGQLREINQNRSIAKEEEREQVSKKMSEQLNQLMNPKKEKLDVVQVKDEQEELKPAHTKQQSYRNQLQQWRKQKGK